MKKYTLLFISMLLISGLFRDAAAVNHTVQVGNFYFSPSTLTVEVGDTVTWIWVQGAHTTTSTSIPAGAATWDHPINSSSTAFSYKVTVAGLHNYKCTPHASMGHLGSFTATAAAPTLSVTPSSQSVGPMTGSVSFEVSSNAGWTASSDAGWCLVTPSGLGNGTLTADYEENQTWESRMANITVMVSGASPVTVTVIQDASTVGIEAPKASSMRIYPNPASSFFQIETGNVSAIEMSVVDLNGRNYLPATLSGNTSYRIDAGSLQPGLYFIRLKVQDETIVRRLVINR